MISGAKLGGFRGWKEVKLEGELDPLVAKQIHGSNPTKLHHTKKSQKNWGYFWWGFFKLGKNTTKSSLKKKGRGSKYVINVAHDTKMM